MASHIRITSESTPQALTVRVQDFGVGIRQENHEKIFERFYRVHDGLLETFPGLGLGLHISSEIIKRENGSIWVESIEGQGSVFSFSLPVASGSKTK